MTAVDQIIAEARSWLGTPYHHAARIKGVGVDCANLLCCVYEDAGLVPHIDPRPYPEDWNLHRSEELFIGWLQKAGAERIDAPEPGCVGLWRYGRTFSHGGIMIDEKTVVHAFRTTGRVCTSRIDQEPLASRAAQWWRIPHGR